MITTQSTREANALQTVHERRAYWLAREKRDWRIIVFAVLGTTGVLSLHNLVGYGGFAYNGLLDALFMIMISVGIGAFMAAYAGLAFAVVAILCLRRRSLLLSGLIIFGPVTVLAFYTSTSMMFAFAGDLTGVVILFLAMCAHAVLCRFLLPQRPFVQPSHLCPICWYDLRAGHPSAGCPECGWGRGGG